MTQIFVLFQYWQTPPSKALFLPKCILIAICHQSISELIMISTPCSDERLMWLRMRTDTQGTCRIWGLFYWMSFLLFCHDKRWEQVTVPCVWQGKSIFVIYRALRRDRGCTQLCFGHRGDKRCAGGLLSEAGAAWVMLTGCWFARVATMRP